MTVRAVDSLIQLTGRCPAEDAEDLLRALADNPDAVVDITGLQHLHMAVMQVLLALRPGIRGEAVAGPLSREIFLDLISDNDIATKNF